MEYKVVHICNSDTGGAGIAARRLNTALRNHGIDSTLLCINKESKDPSVVQFKVPILNKILRHIPIPIGFNKYSSSKVQNILRKYESATFPVSYFDLTNHPLIKNADIINLHWIGGMLNYSQFFRKIKAPIVWTLHDMNPFMGIAHYEGDRKRNVQNIHFEQSVEQSKITAYQKHESISIVNLCNWMYSHSSKSQAFSQRRHFTIPNSVDTATFKIHDKNCVRKALGLPLDCPILMFCSQSVSNPRKGFDILLDAINKISEKTTLLIVGDSSNITGVDNSRLKTFGHVSDERFLSLLYSAADLFILPSREDNLPNTMLESLCCGTPVISFSNGGMKDIINNTNGRLLTEESGSELANEINKLLNNLNQFDSNQISLQAQQLFNPEVQAEKYNKLYSSILK